jgi:hypothetical protein
MSGRQLLDGSAEFNDDNAGLLEKAQLFSRRFMAWER